MYFNIIKIKKFSPKIASKYALIIPIFGSLLSLTACQKSADNPTSQALNGKDVLSGCYTVSKTEPAQIKINLKNAQYTMQMRQFNDPDKPWDTPEPMQTLPLAQSKTYFEVNSKNIEQIITRPDHMFVLAKVQDSLTTLDPRFDSAYLGFIYKGNNTIYRVACEH